MKKHSIFNRAVLLGLCSALTSLGAWGQNINPWLADGLNKQIQQNQQHENAAAQRRAWEARERKIQKEIAELRRTPFYYAVAYDFVNNRVLGGGGVYSEKRAIETALGGCKSSNCQIVATFANACGVVVEPDKGARTVEDFFVGIDPDDRKAAAKAIQACEAKHGNNQCSYWNVKTKTGMAFCSGYDYSIYGQH